MRLCKCYLVIKVFLKIQILGLLHPQFASLKTGKDLMNHFLLERNLFDNDFGRNKNICISVLCNLSAVKSSKVQFLCMNSFTYIFFFLSLVQFVNVYVMMNNKKKLSVPQQAKRKHVKKHESTVIYIFLQHLLKFTTTNLFQYLQFTLFTLSKYWKYQGQIWAKNYFSYFMRFCTTELQFLTFYLH